MSDTLPLKILVIESNKLTPLTVNSIKKNMPEWSYEVVKLGSGFIKTALDNTEDITLCVQSGVILNIQDGDIPDQKLLSEYDICVSRDRVFSDNKANKHVYKLIGSKGGMRNIDLSVFIINPSRWVRKPISDKGVLSKVKRLRMPRHMNHKEDEVIAHAITAKAAMEYGVMGLSASVSNYVSVYERGTANGNEMFAYPLEIALDLLDGLPNEARKKVEAVASKTKSRASKLRRGLSENLPILEI